MLNGQQEAARARTGKAAKVLELSMHGQRRLAARGETVNDAKLAGGVGEMAFDECDGLHERGFCVCVLNVGHLALVVLFG